MGDGGLGIEVNTVELTLTIPVEKWKEIQQLLRSWMTKQKASLKETQVLAGSLNFACRCVKSGRVYLSRILNFLRTLPEFGTRAVPQEVKEDVQWWIEFAPRFNGVSLMTENQWSQPDAVISSDSCLMGGGALCGNEFLHWKFPACFSRKKFDINELECLMVGQSINQKKGYSKM